MPNRPIKLLLIAGARPNFMKVAPLIKAASHHNQQNNGSPKVECRLVHTGQHYDSQMSGIFFKELGIPAPDINLEVGSGSHAVQTANIMTRFEPVLVSERPDWVVVVGDVNSTIACTLVAAKLGVRVTHVEAGLRSFDRTMPEEVNRIVTDALADLLLTPSEDANQHLRDEGIPKEKIRLVGNIMIDTLLENLAKAQESEILKRLNIKPSEFIYVTLHRPANVDTREALSAIMANLHTLADHLPVIFPMHPRTRKMLSEFSIPSPRESRLQIIEPVGYHDSLCLTRNARLVLTDSGGLQEESTYFRTPCLTLRPNTERPVTVTVGSNRLTCVESLSRDVDAVLGRPSRLGEIPPLWDGHTASRVIQNLVEV